ncbi:MAG: phosphatase PAP2 family protein, partial [Anaerolineales bacterium]|nr:phosphatase PAP2 family protein [Anaerolineales bacterium]
GIPSAHAQNAMSVWGIIAANRKQVWLRAICIFLILMIGISRLYLGSHFPHDIVLGWLIGGVLVWGYVRYWDTVAAWLSKKTLPAQMGIAALVTLIFIVVGMGVMTVQADIQMPQSWMDNALLSGTEPDPIDPNTLFTAAGSFLGLALGLAWINSMGGYQATGPVWKRVLRYIIGLVGVLILWQGLGAIFPRGDGFLIYSLRLLRYTLVGAWVSGAAPWLFQHFNLTTSSSRPSSI